MTAQELATRDAALATQDSFSGPMSPSDMVRQVSLIQDVMSAVMRDGEHFGKIPGCGDKPTLLKPGAEKLMLVFRIAPRFTRERIDLPNGHREIISTCELVSINTGLLVGSGAGSCSTMESKYRYRNVSDYELTGEPIPKDSKERKAEYRKQGFGMKKVDGAWEWVKFKDGGKVDNPDIADTYNTVLKMADKRALVAATLIATGASDIFTQDIEDLNVPEAVTATPTTASRTRETIQVPTSAAVSPETLADIRRMRNELDVSHETYMKQLAYYGVDDDEKLTETNAKRLLTTYTLKLAEIAARETSQPDFGDDEIPF